MRFWQKDLDIYQDPKVKKVKIWLTGALTEGFFYKGGISLKVAWFVQNYRKKRKDEFGNCLGLFPTFSLLFICIYVPSILGWYVYCFYFANLFKGCHGAIFLNVDIDLCLDSYKFHTDFFLGQAPSHSLLWTNSCLLLT